MPVILIMRIIEYDLQVERIYEISNHRVGSSDGGILPRVVCSKSCA